MKLGLAKAGFLAWPTWILASAVFPCEFSVDNHEYNLCPVIRNHPPWNIVIEMQTPPTFTRNFYAFSFEPLAKDPTLPADLQCPDGTWICLSVENTRPNHPSEPPRILQVVPVAGGPDIRPTAKLGISGELVIHLHGGSYANRTQKASIQFFCAQDDTQEPSQPTFSWSFNGTHAFEWVSKYACPHNPPGSPPMRHPESDEADTPPHDVESETDSELKRNDNNKPYSPLQITIFVVSCLLLLRFLFSYLRPSRLQSSFRRLRYNNHYHGFRPSATQLFLWVQQAGFDEDSQLEYMTDSHDQYDLDSNGEEIPLTPNPRQTVSGGKWSRGDASPGIYGSFQT